MCSKSIGITSIPTNSPWNDKRLLLCPQGCDNNAHASLMKDKLKSGDDSTQGLVPMALKADLSASPTDSILNSLSKWNLQEALEEWIIHSLVLLPMDLCFLVPMRCSVFVLTVIGDFCTTFDGSWGQQEVAFALLTAIVPHTRALAQHSFLQKYSWLHHWHNSWTHTKLIPSPAAFSGSCWHLLCYNIVALVWTLPLKRWHLVTNWSPVVSYTMGSTITAGALGRSWPCLSTLLALPQLSLLLSFSSWLGLFPSLREDQGSISKNTQKSGTTEKPNTGSPGHYN